MLAVRDPEDSAPALPPWTALRLIDLWRWPLPHLASPSDRLLTRLAGLMALGPVAQVEGWERIQPVEDPFLLVANHGSRREAVLLPTILLLARGGKAVRFLADWNFRLIPGVGYLYDRGGTITLTRKDAKPRILNRLKPLFEPPMPAHVEALHHLQCGGAVGIFPEGTVNRDPDLLLRGRRGAARLSLEAGVPVIPVGIRLTRRNPLAGPGRATTSMTIRIGEALHPPPSLSLPASLDDVRAWHGELMTAIAALCGKRWPGATVGDGAHACAWPPPPTLTEHRIGGTAS